jgi:hypothetical protein
MAIDLNDVSTIPRYLSAKHPISGVFEACEYVATSRRVRFPDGQFFPIEGLEVRPLEVEKAQEMEKTIDETLDQRVRAVLIHIPTRASAHAVVKLRQVRAWAETSVGAFNTQQQATGKPVAPFQDFIVVEVRGDTVKVTTLEA